jgi:hypothetical protein
MVIEIMLGCSVVAVSAAGDVVGSGASGGGPVADVFARSGSVSDGWFRR